MTVFSPFKKPCLPYYNCKCWKGKKGLKGKMTNVFLYFSEMLEKSKWKKKKKLVKLPRPSFNSPSPCKTRKAYRAKKVKDHSVEKITWNWFHRIFSILLKWKQNLLICDFTKYFEFYVFSHCDTTTRSFLMNSQNLQL